MKTLNRIIEVPKYLHELHGERTSRLDLLATYLVAIVATTLIVYMGLDLSLPFYKFILLGVLAFDIAGGVTANFTSGTQHFYSKKSKLRYRFISLHVLHPSILMFVFPGSYIYIIILSVFTLIVIALLNGIKNESNQRVLASFFTVIGVTLSFVMEISEPIVQLMMVLFIIKLIISFSIKWK